MDTKNRKTSTQNLLAKLPSVDSLMTSDVGRTLCEIYSMATVKAAIVNEITKLRKTLKKSEQKEITRDELIHDIVQTVTAKLEQEFQPSLKRVINATGIVLHTGLGRASLVEEARQNVAEVTENYCNLELNLEDGKRGNRISHIENHLSFLTGAEAACVVNNNAAAVLLSLNTLAAGRESIISRGQLVEIGGSFRMPEVMQKSNTIMVEIGATNKTKLRDYEKAISENTGVLVVVHTSNYRVMGFTAEPPLSEIVDLAHAHDLPVLHDLGGGVLIDLRKYNLPYEPLVQESIAAGTDVVTFSGDKVLGGPQSGLIVGKKKYLDKIKENPFLRAFRCGKLTLAALEPTIKMFYHPDELPQKHNVLRMMTESRDVVERRASKVAEKLKKQLSEHFEITVEKSVAQAGSGALPLEKIDSAAVVLRPLKQKASTIAAKLRTRKIPIIGYVKDEKVFLDMRTVRDDEITVILETFDNLAS